MDKTKYNQQAKLIASIVDIAIDCITNNPPEELGESFVKQFVNVYLDYKNSATNPKPEYHNLNSLKQILNDILIYFQESSGKAVDAFWLEADKKELGIKKVDRFAKILKRGKIKDHVEYDIIIDLYNPYIEANKLSQEKVDKINQMISNFENASSI